MEGSTSALLAGLVVVQRTECFATVLSDGGDVVSTRLQRIRATVVSGDAFKPVHHVVFGVRELAEVQKLLKINIVVYDVRPPPGAIVICSETLQPDSQDFRSVGVDDLDVA